MLKCVVFPVTAYGYEVLWAVKEQIDSALASGGVLSRMVCMREESGLEEILRYASEQDRDAYEEVFSKEEVLFVTDSRRMFDFLQDAGCYSIAFYHEKNKQVFFDGALYAVEDIGQLSLKSYEEAYRRLASIPWDILETKRLKVRESTVEDVEDFYRIYATPSITRYMEDLFNDPDEERVYMEEYIKQFYGFYGFGMWTVIHKETGKVIGRAGLSVREGYELPELGFVIEVPFQGKGLACEVCQGILGYAKEELLFDKVQALVEPENEASLRLLEKLGFEFAQKVREAGREYLLYINEL